MKVLSVSTGRAKEITWNGHTIMTSMAREIQEAIEVRFSGVVGDQFSSPKIHGTPESAVYMYSASQFPVWKNKINREVSAAEFGENITVDHFDEKDLYLGDVYQVGEVQLAVTGPRYPCNRLNYRFQIANMQSLFEEQDHPGVYFQVLREGRIRAGDTLQKISSQQKQFSVYDLYLTMRQLRTTRPLQDRQFQERLAALKACPALLPFFSSRLK